MFSWVVILFLYLSLSIKDVMFLTNEDSILKLFKFDFDLRSLISLKFVYSRYFLMWHILSLS